MQIEMLIQEGSEGFRHVNIRRQKMFHHFLPCFVFWDPVKKPSNNLSQENMKKWSKLSNNLVFSLDSWKL